MGVMSDMTRREFFAASALAAGAVAMTGSEVFAAEAQPLGMPAGFQVYTIREMLAKDFAGTLKMMADMGYRTVEMCSPPGYVGSGFEPLTKMTASEMKQIIEAAGLRCESCHYNFQELRENLDERLAFAKELGLTQMIASGFWLKPDAKLADWLSACDELNKLGERTKKEGIQLGYHNHHFEFKELEGVLIYDAIMGKLDPALIKMQFQVAVVNIGYQAVTYFEKYPGRFISLHLADWSSAEKKAVPIGQGIVDWKKLFENIKPAGVKNYFVEMDYETLKPSVDYLNALKI